MIKKDIFESCVLRAGLAPTVHNTQPARWKQDGGVVSLFCDTNVGLGVGDPHGRDAALSCGAVLEAMVLALSVHGLGVASVDYTGNDTAPGQGLVAVAHLMITDGEVDALNEQLEQRFTWRGPFVDETPDLFGWTRPDARLILDQAGKDWLAQSNDLASLHIMQSLPFRRELVSWMRLDDAHPRAGIDGMDRASLLMSKREARFVPFILKTFWGVLNLMKITKSITSEADVTSTTPVIALFHRDIHEDPVASGRAYLRMCLEAASLGFASWPMAALTDHPATRDALQEQFGISSDRRLIQAVRFGKPVGVAPPRARRPLAEVIR